MGRLKTNVCVGMIGVLVLSSLDCGGEEESRRPVEGIMDNSFLIEEAYNQEPGVVQHIFNAIYGVDKLFRARNHEVLLAITEEWPIFTQKHQFSYTVPYSFTW